MNSLYWLADGEMQAGKVCAAGPGVRVAPEKRGEQLEGVGLRARLFAWLHNDSRRALRRDRSYYTCVLAAALNGVR